MEHDGTDLQFMNDSEPPNVFELRGYHVMLAAKVAEVFEVEMVIPVKLFSITGNESFLILGIKMEMDPRSI